jgi:NAD(P)-dependent dehydrogenase (short-subunit alcohol dehydrogenase family)
VRSSAQHFGSIGVRINAVCPGIVNTPMNIQNGLSNGMEDPIVDPEDLPLVPYCGIARAQHIAELVLFLASSRANFITGSVYTADGGITCALPTAPPK